MSLTMKPHQAQICPIDVEIDTTTNQVLAADFTRTRSIRCRMVPIGAEAAFREFGVQIQTGQKLLCELSDAPADRETNGRVLYAGTLYRIVDIVRHGSTKECAYASVLLEREK